VTSLSQYSLPRWSASRTTFVAVAVVVMMLHAAAQAQAADSCVARGDIAASDQYCEAVPVASAGLPTPARERGTAVSAATAPALELVLPSRTVDRLRDAGPIGAAVLDLRSASPPASDAPIAKVELDPASLAGNLWSSSTSDAPKNVAQAISTTASSSPGPLTILVSGILAAAGLGTALRKRAGV
jgi:hypothetical protein